MRLKFKHQKFQADAAKAVCDVFVGQPCVDKNTYQIDPGRDNKQGRMRSVLFTGFANSRLVPPLTKDVLLQRIQRIQNSQMIKPSDKLEGDGINLTIEMETGVGKTYTYIKTIYELNKLYGWSKFIIVVPSVAIREGVYKSFQITADHFKEEYNKQVRFFIYNSANLQDISQFASDSNINAMIINSQAFNAKSEKARRIGMELDEFNSRKPIDVIARTNPILIIDEPQSVEGKTTKESLKKFNALFTLRYSATHKKDSIYNMVYRLDAIEAYNQRLVKKISVKGITASTITGTDGYLYLQNLVLSPNKPPMAKIEFEIAGTGKVRRKTQVFAEGDNLFASSNNLNAYKDRYTIKTIDGRDNSVEFLNGIKIYVGDVLNDVNEDHMRRIQIRETIISHLERERQLFAKGIKVLSLFFIDKVENYKVYDETNTAFNGDFANIFEEEYESIVQGFITDLASDSEFKEYLKNISANSTHAGYFSIDKKTKKFVDSDTKEDKKAKLSNDVDAYDLIMKNKERLLDIKEPVRFIFSHSALREGWDNPNVFQICTLKQSSAEVRKRQEVGRGLRLCVNKDGERMDVNAIGQDVHNINVLTVIASESYDKFAQGLQTEYAEAVSDRPEKVNIELFKGRTITSNSGEEIKLSSDDADAICTSLVVNGYATMGGKLTDKYYEDKFAGKLNLPDNLKDLSDSIVKVLDNIYDEDKIKPEDARGQNVSLTVNSARLASKEFKALWEKISSKSAYCVEFDTAELIKHAVDEINSHLEVSKNFYVVQQGSMNSIDSKDSLSSGSSFAKQQSKVVEVENSLLSNVKYDLIGKIVTETGLTRKTIAEILRNIRSDKFDLFKVNPEEFIIKVSTLINERKATAIVQHITYKKLEDSYDTSIFTEPSLKGKLGVNAMATQRQLYDYLIWDSRGEKEIAKDFEASEDVAIYVKLPKTFYISTPVGKYSPDWAIAFKAGSVKHIYFVAETKGDMSTLNLREIENAKISCARKHFAAICPSDVKYDFINNYTELLNKVMKD